MRLPLRRHPMHFKKYLIAGLLVWLPLAITVWVLTWLYGVLDGVFAGLLGAVTALVIRLTSTRQMMPPTEN